MNGLPVASRRDRVRASTVEEIKRTARVLLRKEGQAGMSLRAIAREMGMTAPALYRYYPSHDDLAAAMVADLYTELADLLIAVRDAIPADRVKQRLICVAFTYRDWSIANPREFALVFGSPLPALASLAVPHEERCDHLAGMRFGRVFTEVFLATWQEAPFPVESDDSLPPALVTQLGAYREALVELIPNAEGVPVAAINVFLQCWVQLFGLIAMEVFDHLHFCLSDVGPFFHAAMDLMATRLGLDVEELHRLKDAGECDVEGLRAQAGVTLTPSWL